MNKKISDETSDEGDGSGHESKKKATDTHSNSDSHDSVTSQDFHLDHDAEALTQQAAQDVTVKSSSHDDSLPTTDRIAPDHLEDLAELSQQFSAPSVMGPRALQSFEVSRDKLGALQFGIKEAEISWGDLRPDLLKHSLGFGLGGGACLFP